MNEICLSCKKHTKCGRAIHETIGCGYYVPQTNEEWFCSLPTKEKADLLAELVWWIHPSVQGGRKMELTKESFLQWLQEEHQDEY